MKKKIIQQLAMCFSVILIFGSICVYGLVEGEVLAASKSGFFVERTRNPLWYWFSEAAWFFPCGLLIYALVGYFKRIPKLLAAERADQTGGSEQAKAITRDDKGSK